MQRRQLSCREVVVKPLYKVVGLLVGWRKWGGVGTFDEEKLVHFIDVNKLQNAVIAGRTPCALNFFLSLAPQKEVIPK